MASSKEAKNVTWNPIMTEFLLNYLAEQAKTGLRGPKGFGLDLLTTAANEINKKFGKKLMYYNVQNHLKTLRRWWRTIQKLKKIDGVIFNSNTHTIEMDHDEYEKYVRIHPGDAQFINKHIKLYEQIQIVCGNSGELGFNNSALSYSSPPDNILQDDNLDENENELEDEELQVQALILCSNESSKIAKCTKNVIIDGSSSTRRIRTLKGNAKWNPIMTGFLLNYLNNEVKSGKRNSNNKFRIISLNNAAQAINEKFGKNMTTCHVQNHLKTIKKWWRTIQQIKKLEGVTFNYDTRTLHMNLKDYQNHVQVRPSDDPFINKPIKFYDEMEIICGNEKYVDLNGKNNNDDDDNSPCEISSDSKMDGGDLELDLLTPHDDCDNGSISNRLRKRKKSKQIDENFTSNDGNKRKHKNLNWSNQLSQFLLKYLANEARMGFKGSNGFKSSALVRAVNAINEKFGKNVTFSNVQNHIRTLKKRWKKIQNWKTTNGVVFNHETNKLEIGLEENQNLDEVRQCYDEFINKPVDLLVELEIVCGDNNDLLKTPLVPLSPRKIDKEIEEYFSDSGDEDQDEEENQQFDSIPFNIDIADSIESITLRKLENKEDINDNNDNNNNIPCEEMQVWFPHEDRDNGSSSNESRKRKKIQHIDENVANNTRKNDANSRKNVNWNREMSDFLLKFLANEARMGAKSAKGFKSSSYVRAVRAIKEKFGKEMAFSNIQNHMKTFKRRWRSIQSLKKIDGAVFNQDTSTIEMGPQEYQICVQERPSDDLFINKPINLLLELEIICGDDNNLLSTPLVPLSPPNNNFETNIDNSRENEDSDKEETPISEKIVIDNNNSREKVIIEDKEKEPQQYLTPPNNNIKKGENNNEESSSKMTNKAVDPTAEKLLNLVGHMAGSMKGSSNDETIRFAKEIMEELRTIKEGFSFRALRSAQRYLVENSLDGACFMSYDKEEKIAWMNDFITDNLGDNAS